jgi:hypothetical protein
MRVFDTADIEKLDNQLSQENLIPTTGEWNIVITFILGVLIFILGVLTGLIIGV